jgi:abhydrolase domain-containing protein 5
MRRGLDVPHLPFCPLFYANMPCFALPFHIQPGRPKYTARTREEAEAFFTDSLAEWVRKQGLDKKGFVLMGHSLGGYLGATYALKYPEHVKHLVLVGPAGIPKPKPDWIPERLRSPTSMAGLLFRFFGKTWEWGLTPGTIVRFLGPLGPNLVHKYAFGRFRSAGLTEDETLRFRDYLYAILSGRGSGEHALRHLLAPFAWAHHPWEDRLHELQMPVTFIYGE